MSALLRGPSTEPRASTKLDETLEAKGGYMDIYTVLLIVILTFGIGFVLNLMID